MRLRPLRRPDEPTEWVRSMDRNLFDSRRFLEAQTSNPDSPAPQPAAATAPEASEPTSENPPEPVETFQELDGLFIEP